MRGSSIGSAARIFGLRGRRREGGAKKMYLSQPSRSVSTTHTHSSARARTHTHTHTHTHTLFSHSSLSLFTHSYARTRPRSSPALLCRRRASTLFHASSPFLSFLAFPALAVRRLVLLCAVFRRTSAIVQSGERQDHRCCLLSPSLPLPPSLPLFLRLFARSLFRLFSHPPRSLHRASP